MVRARTDLPILDENPLDYHQYIFFEKASQSIKAPELKEASLSIDLLNNFIVAFCVKRRHFCLFLISQSLIINMLGLSICDSVTPFCVIDDKKCS